MRMDHIAGAQIVAQYARQGHDGAWIARVGKAQGQRFFKRAEITRFQRNQPRVLACRKQVFMQPSYQTLCPAAVEAGVVDDLENTQFRQSLS